MKAPSTALSAVLGAHSELGFLGNVLVADSGLGFLRPRASAPVNATAATWLQGNQIICGNRVFDPCKIESAHALLLVILLSCVIALMLCAFAFFREDKEELITPLSPVLVVKDGDLRFKLPLHEQRDQLAVTDVNDDPLCKVVVDWPDPLRPGASGVAAVVRLLGVTDQTLATVVARTMAVVGQGLAICRAGCEIFGFIEADGPSRYQVRHRTGVHLLTLIGDFDDIDVIGVNPMGVKVFSLKLEDGECKGTILQNVDAGLMLCAILAANVHRRLIFDKLLPRPRPKHDSEGEAPSNVPEDREAPTAGTGVGPQEEHEAQTEWVSDTDRADLQ